MFGLSQIQLIIIGALLAAVLTAGGIMYIYSKGEKAGSSGVTTKVQQETIKTLDAARKAKDQADKDVRSQPYDERVESLGR